MRRNGCAWPTAPRRRCAVRPSLVMLLAAVAMPLDEDLGQAVVFEGGDPGLVRIGLDEHFYRHGIRGVRSGEYASGRS